MQVDDRQSYEAGNEPASVAPLQPEPARHWSHGRLGVAGGWHEPAADSHPIKFLGSGSEYFRIWIVNLCLSIATLGIYSAWAKVRRLQYFERNTQLAGAVFNFHGNPKAILKGRVVALLLLVAYHYAFGFSKAIGVAVVFFLFISMPWFLRSALYFRARNTSYRGLRFDFNGSLSGAYSAYLPMMLVFLLPGTLLTLYPDRPIMFVSFASYLLWPLLHARIKRYQHQNIRYGSSAAEYSLPSSRFWRPYLMATLFGVLILIAVFGVSVLISLWASHSGLPSVSQSASSKTAASLSGLAIVMVTMYLLYLISGPYLQARVQNLVWSCTSFPQTTIQSTLNAGPYMRLQAANVLLTILSLGLYRPFALVKVHRYRLEHVSILAPAGFENVLASGHRMAGGASGEGTADFMGMDISW